MRNLILHELQQFFYELRLPIALSIVLLMFAVSAVTYISEYDENVAKYRELTANQEQALRDRAVNATVVAITSRDYQLPPRNNGFISDCGELNIPNTLEYTAFRLLHFGTSLSRENPLFMASERINWGFIMTVLFGFLAIIFSFDALSGEKEQRTLALCLSNPVKRSHILFAKFIAINALLTACALLGILLSLVILTLSPSVSITAETLSEIGLFLLFVIFFTGSMSAIGLFASVMSHNSNISLMLSVSLWLVFMIAIPNFAHTLGMAAWPVEKADVMQARILEKTNDIVQSYPSEATSANFADPFYPSHEIRADLMMDLNKGREDFWNEHYAARFSQVDNTRRWTWVSPLTVFGYGTEALLDGGYTRLRRNYDNLQNFKTQYLQWFIDFDARDDRSPHWLNPMDNISTTKKPVAYEEIPQYAERSATVARRLAETMKYLAVMLAYMGIMLLLAIIRFERYDVR
jgi:ABC-type transport system involved in multi-copper enzyme maturation permease subunit